MIVLAAERTLKQSLGIRYLFQLETSLVSYEEYPDGS